MPKMANDQASLAIQEIVNEYIGLKSWFYQQQIAPYLPELANHVLNELAKRGIQLTQDKPKAK